MVLRDQNSSWPQAKAILFDWAGTTIDHGSLAPVEVLLEVFRQREIDIPESEIRRPMGKSKDAHIAELLRLTHVEELWRQRYGRPPGDEDVRQLYSNFLPLQKQILARHAEPITGVVNAVGELQKLGIRIGSTTGYTRELMEIVLPIAAKAGYRPAVTVCADDVAKGRPAPDMNLRAMSLLGLVDPADVIAVDDTLAGVAAGVAAGMRTVAVSLTGNGLGLSAEAAARLDAEELRSRLDELEAAFLQAGADSVVRSVADLPTELVVRQWV